MRIYTRLFSFCAALICLSGTARAQLTGTIAVPSTGYPNLAAVIDSLNSQGVGAGGVIVNVTAAQTAPVGGYRLGSATLNASTSTSKKVVINGGGNTVTAYVGTSTTADGIFYIQGTDWVEINRLNLTEASGNNTATRRMEWGYSLVKLRNTAPYDGCQNVLINNCTISLEKTYTNTVAIRAAHALAGATTVLGTTGLTAASANSRNRFTANTIRNVTRGISLIGINSDAYYDYDNRIGGPAAADGNTISVGGSTYVSYAIYTQYDSVITFSNNKLSIATGQNADVYLINPDDGLGNLTVTNNTFNVSCSMTTHDVFGYYNDQTHRDAKSGPAATSTHTITGNLVTGNNTAATSGYLYGLYEDYAYCLNLDMSNNTVRDIDWGTGTGYIYGIAHYYTDAMNITDRNNLVYNVEKQGTSGYLYLQYYYEPGAPSGAVLTVENNVTRKVRNRQTYVYPIYVYAGSATTLPMPRLVSRYNVVDSIDMSTATSTTYCRSYFGYYGGDNSISEHNSLTNVTGGTATTYVYTYMGYTGSGRKTYTARKNRIDNISGVTLYAYNYLGYYATMIDSNELSNIRSTTGGTFYNYLSYEGDSTIAHDNYVHNINMGGSAILYNYIGMYTLGSRIYNNVIDSISTQSGTIYGQYSSAYGHNIFYNNRLSRVYSNSTSNTIYGWYMNANASGSYTAYNNVISDIYVPAGYSSASSSAMNMLASVDYQIYNNTIRVAPGVAAAFVGIDYVAGASVDLRNNIIYVDATPGATGFTAAMLRSTGTAGTRPANFLPTSNGNIFYSPNATNSWLYAEGTASSLVNTYNLGNDPAFNSACGLFKNFMGHNFASFTENNLVAGTTPGTYRPTGTSYAEKGAVPVPVSITTDYDNAARGTPADIGALEFNGTARDNTPPAIAYTPVPTQSYCLSTPQIVATITDLAGVNNTPGFAPRLYYKKANNNGNDADVFGVANNSSGNGWKWVEATSVSGSQYTFDFDYSLLRSTVVPGDSIKYFIIAQDLSAATNTGATVANFTTCPTSVDLDAANGPLLAQPEAAGFRVLIPPGFTASAAPHGACQSGSTTLSIVPTPYGTGVQWQSATLSGSFANIPGATNATYTTPVLSQSTRYRAVLVCGSSVLDTTRIDTFIIAQPGIVSVSGATICGFDSTTLSAVTTTGTTAKWYAAPTGGVMLATGNSFTTPQIGATTTYYVTAVTPNATPETLSAVKRVPAYSSSVSNGVMSFRFNNSNTNFYSTTIYPWNATVGSTVTFRIYDSAGFASGMGTPIAPAVTTTLPIVGDGTIPHLVNFPWRNIAAGRYYVEIEMGTGARLNYDYPVSLPIVSPSGGGEIVGTDLLNNTDYYYPYMFSNIIGADCETPTRTPVTVTVNPAPAITASSPQEPGICLGGTATLNVSSANPYYNFTWMPGGITSQSFIATPASSTNYRVRAVDPYTGCVAVDSVMINVNAQPAAPVITPNPARICGGNPVQLTAAMPSGINNLGTIGTGTSSTSSAMPYYTLYTRFHVQYLVTAAELNTMGVSGPTSLKSWAVNVASAGTVAGNFNIRIAHAGNTSALSKINCSYPGAFQQVYNNASYQPTTGWNTHTFQSPFAWDGSSNIVIDVTFDKSPACSGTVSGTSSTVYYHSAGTGSSIYFYSNTDCTVTGCSTNTTYTTSNRPNMQIGFGPPAVINWLNVGGLYTAANLATPLTLADTISAPFAAPATTTAYRAVVNVQGCVSPASAPDTVYVTPAPNVTVTPAGPQTICAGQSVSLCVPIASNVTYQWYLNNNAIAGATSNCHSAAAAGTYKVTATDIITGCIVTSINIPLTVNPAPALTVTRSGTGAICKGVNDTLTASGTGIVSYQWKESGVAIPGATSATLVVSATGTYTVEVANANGCIATSTPVTITVNVTPTTIAPQGPTNICSGSVVLQAPTAPAGATYAYQWREGGVNITGATASSYTASTTGSYSVVVTNTTTGCTDSSVAVPVNIGAAPVSAITPGGTNAICQGDSVVLNAISQPGLCYQWNLNGTPVPGATAASFTAKAAGSYTVTVSICSAPACVSTTAAPAVISVNPAPVASAAAAGGTTFCQGGNVVINANTGANLSYQWNLNGAAIPGETAASITAVAGGTYTVTVTHTLSGCSAESNGVAVTVNNAPGTAITSTTPTTFCQGGNVSLCAPAGATSYAWNLNGTPISGATSPCYTASATGMYSVTVSGANGCTATSAQTAVQVNTLPDVTTTPAAAATVCQGSAVQLAVTTDTSHSYQWMLNGVNISGATSATYAASSAGTYAVKKTNNVTGCEATSADIQVTVNTAPTATASVTGSPKLCQGDSIRITAGSGAGYTYQWRRNGVVIAGETGNFIDASQSGSYTVVVNDGSGCTGVSNAIVITVDPRPAAYITYNTPLEFCEGSAVVLTANPGAGLTYQWLQDGVPNGNNGSFNEATTTGRYTLRVTNSAGCSSTADTLNVTVHPKPVPVVVRSGATLQTSTPFASYQWYFNNLPIGGAFGPTHTFTGNGGYKVRVIDANGCEGMSDVFFVNNVGINTAGAGKDIRVFPNPTSGIVNIDAGIKVKLALRDVAGKVVLQAADVKQINLGDLAAGMYMLYISDMNGNLLRADKITKTAN